MWVVLSWCGGIHIYIPMMILWLIDSNRRCVVRVIFRNPLTSKAQYQEGNCPKTWPLGLPLSQVWPNSPIFFLTVLNLCGAFSYLLKWKWMTSNLWPVSIGFSFGGVVGCYIHHHPPRPRAPKSYGHPGCAKKTRWRCWAPRWRVGCNHPTELERSRGRLVGLGDENPSRSQLYRDDMGWFHMTFV